MSLFDSLKNIEMPHVLVLLTLVIFFTSILTYIIPSGSYDRQEELVGGRSRTIVVPGTFTHLEKEITLNSILFENEQSDKVKPVSVTGFLSAIPRGLVDSADIVFFIFII